MALALLLLCCPLWAAEPEAKLTGPARVEPGALILLSPAGSVSDAPPVVVSEVGQPPELDPTPLYTPDGKGGYSPFAWIATAPTIHGTYRFVSIASGKVDGQERHSAATFAVTVGPLSPPPVDPDPPAPPVPPGPGPGPGPTPPGPGPGPPAPPSGPDEYGAAQTMYEFASPLPDRGEGVKYAASLDAYAGRVEEFRKPGHDALGKYWTETFAALTALSGNGPAGWGLLDNRLGDVLRATAEEGRIVDEDGYHDAGVYQQIFTDAARGLRAAAGVSN